MNASRMSCGPSSRVDDVRLERAAYLDEFGERTNEPERIGLPLGEPHVFDTMIPQQCEIVTSVSRKHDRVTHLDMSAGKVDCNMHVAVSIIAMIDQVENAHRASPRIELLSRRPRDEIICHQASMVSAAEPANALKSASG
jgi:hypothetical protein